MLKVQSLIVFERDKKEWAGELKQPVMYGESDTKTIGGMSKET